MRTRLFSGVAALACSGGMALAQTPAPPAAAAPSDSFNIEAKSVEYDKDGVVIAKGDVEGRYLDRTLRGDQVTFDKNNRLIDARGNVQIIDSEGNAEFAHSITMDQDMRAGVAIGFSARQGQAKFAAASAIKLNENLNELNMAIFTLCDICLENGDPKTPTWSVSADQIVQDHDRKLVYYRNATIRMKGVPVFWSPIFWHADPEAERVSGFLSPRFQQTRRRGLSYEQPYLWSISPYQDLVIDPQFNTEVNPFLNLNWRKRFYSGGIDARVGYTHDQDFNTQGAPVGPDRNKAYILASGEFKPFENWDWGFTAERAQDKFLFDQYSIRDIYKNRGAFLSDDRRLLSQLYAARQTQRAYLSIAALSFQSLRPLLSVTPNAFGIRPFEDDDTLPIIAPLIEGRYEPEGPILGGRLRLRGGGVVLARSESPSTPGAAGIDSSRATVEGDWRRAFTLAAGVRIEPFADARGDYYRVDDQTAKSTTTSRAFGTVGVDVSWPFIRQFGGSTVIVEPLAQLAISPDPRLYPTIPNEDSIAFDFDDTNLFEPNKSPGFDLYEGGQRLNVGVRATAQWGEGRSGEILVGRSFRAQIDPTFAARTGLRERSSDWVFAAQATPIKDLSFYAKARLDDETLDIRRVEFGADVNLARGDGYVRYLREDQDFAGVPREDIETAGEVFLTAHWGVSFDAIHDLEAGVWRRRTAGIVYRDECIRFDVLYQRDDNPVLGGRSSHALSIHAALPF
ncbi:LPS-assembly protein LptD [soil metagenome]